MNNSFGTKAKLALACILSKFVLGICDGVDPKKKSLEMLHNGFRFTGSNEIPIDGANFYNYVLGAASGGALLLLVWIILGCSFCCLGCCRKSCQSACTEKCLSTALMVAVTVSCLGWLFALGGSATMDRGVDDTQGGVSDFFDYLDDVQGGLLDIVNFAPDVLGDIFDANSTCLIFQATGEAFPSGELEGFAINTGDFALFGGEISDFNDDVDEAFQSFNSYFKRVKMVINFLNVIMILLLLSLGTTVLIRYLDTQTSVNIPKGLAKFQNKVYGSFMCLFGLGILVCFLILLIAPVFGVIATMGSDVCIPSFTENAITLVQLVSEEPSIDPCLPGGSGGIIGPATCHYGTCSGNNPIFDELGINTSSISSEGVKFINVAVEAAVEAINTIIQELNNTPFPGNITIDGLGTIDEATFNQQKDVCIGAVSGITDKFSQIDDLFLLVIDLLSCQIVTPIYQNIFENSFCNGVVGGLAQLYLAWVVGAIGFIFAAMFHLSSQLDKREQEKVVMAISVPEEVANPTVKRSASL